MSHPLPFRFKVLLCSGVAVSSCLLVAASIAAIGASPARAGLFDGPVDRLPVMERVALRQGKALVTGTNGQFVAKVLVNGSPDTVWQVLTDYNNFSKFLPNVISCKIIDTKINGKVVEQVTQQQVFLVSVRSRIRYATVETDKKRIDFKLIEGDLTQMEGFWQLEPVGAYRGARPNQVLITYEVTAKYPSAPQDVFDNTYKDSLNDTLQAIRQEILRRT